MIKKITDYSKGILLLLLIWWILSFLFNKYVVPNPLIVISSIIEDWSTHKDNLLHTGFTALLGILLSVIISIISIVTMMIFPKLEQIIYPSLVMLKATPAVAIAPVIIAIIGTGIVSKILISSLISFFPMVIGAIDGIKQTPKSILLLAKMYDSSNQNKIYHIQYGYFLNGLLSGLKTSAPLAVVGAIVSEYIIGGANYGIGTFIIANVYSSIPINIFSGALLSTFLGLLFFFTASLLFNFYEKKLRINN